MAVRLPLPVLHRRHHTHDREPHQPQHQKRQSEQPEKRVRQDARPHRVDAALGAVEQHIHRVVQQEDHHPDPPVVARVGYADEHHGGDVVDQHLVEVFPLGLQEQENARGGPEGHLANVERLDGERHRHLVCEQTPPVLLRLELKQHLAGPVRAVDTQQRRRPHRRCQVPQTVPSILLEFESLSRLGHLAADVSEEARPPACVLVVGAAHKQPHHQQHNHPHQQMQHVRRPQHWVGEVPPQFAWQHERLEEPMDAAQRIGAVKHDR
mmetsp:Transcript_10639/g.25808  ORF Transcript_10639/g.25808 Transcript_10639/m.25808 type:complete len:266 (-) Transcript_10639:82-879(-)